VAIGGKSLAKTHESPYLNDANRLADVIAAIQAMATYKFYKLDFNAWADRIVGDKGQAAHWQKVFEQHPEFFRLDSGRQRASLVWRRQRQKRFDVDTEASIAKSDYDARDDAGKARVSRNPLNTSEIATLIDAAINLHSRALDHRRESRWWLPIVVAVVAAASGLVGAVVGALIQAA
jgi:hypothetical protein